MSFRKRGDVLNGRDSGVRVAVGRTVVGGPDNLRNGRHPQAPQVAPGRLPIAGSRSSVGIIGRGGFPRAPAARMANLNINDSSNAHDGGVGSLDDAHPGVRPSPASSQKTTSTGCSHLDRVLGHMGLPLGNSMIVEEQGTTEFSSVLCKLFAAQGIMHNRAESLSSHSDNTHLCVVSSNHGFSKDLPGTYKGSSKEIKKSKIAKEQSKVTVQNLSEQAIPSRYKDLKIAWRYKLGEEKEREESHSESATPENEYKEYNHQFDITSRLMPAPTSSEISFVSPNQPIQRILLQLEQIIQKHDKKLIRLIIPSLLHPAMYPPDSFRLSGIVPLMHGLRSLVKKYESRCVLIATVSTDIVDELVMAQIEATFDSVINLEPFSQEMLQFLEKAYKSQPNKVQHGLLHIAKLPVFSDRGEMHVMRSHYAFKNSRKKFEIEEWGIPVGDVDDSSNDQSGSSAHAHEHSGSIQASGEPVKSTNISIDF